MFPKFKFIDIFLIFLMRWTESFQQLTYQNGKISYLTHFLGSTPNLERWNLSLNPIFYGCSVSSSWGVINGTVPSRIHISLNSLIPDSDQVKLMFSVVLSFWHFPYLPSNGVISSLGLILSLHCQNVWAAISPVIMNLSVWCKKVNILL